MWFLAQMEPDSAAYHVPLVLRLTGRLNEQALLAAVRDVAQRHRVLRGVVDADGPEPRLRTVAAADIPVSVRDVRDDELSQALRAETGRPFRLTAEPPMRAALLRLPGAWVLALTVHHIATDGWSHSIIIRDLAALYRARCGLDEPALPPAPQYADIVAARPADDPDADLDWWTGYLAGLSPVLDLPTDRPRTLTSAWPGGSVPVALPPDLAAQVRAVAAGASATAYMVLMAAWQALLGRLAGTDDVVVGLPHAARHSAAAENTVGCFLDTLVVRTDLSGDPTGSDLVARVRASALDAYGHARTPFQRIVERLRPERTLSATPVYQVMLNVHDGWEAADLPGVRVESLTVLPPNAKVDLDLELTDDGPGAAMHGLLAYRADLFDPQTAERLAQWYLTLLGGLVADPTRPVGEISLEPLAGPALAGPPAAPAGMPVHRRIEQWADERPDAVAVVGADGQLTYRQLEHRANRLAHRLIGEGVLPDQPVGVLLDPGTDFATAVLAVLKAGGAYLPMDAAYPASRIREMLRTAGARVVVTTGELAERVRPVAEPVELPGALDDGPDDRPAVAVEVGHLAHVIFTSGSTGTPKGVAVEHGNLSHAVTGLLSRMPQVAGGRSRWSRPSRPTWA
jgi:hypothetical protein